MNLKKKFITVALSVNLLGLNILPVLALDFYDVTPNYWAYNSIQDLSQKNILSGYEDNSFRPDNPVTRAEFSTMIIKALQMENMPVTGKINFKDISPSFWAYDNIQRAYKLGLTRGFPDNTFKSSSYITKAEILAILASAAKVPPVTRPEAQEILNRFYDSSRVPEWAIIPDARAVRAGLAVNYPQPNFLMPQKRVSRAEVAVMLANLRVVMGLDTSANILSQAIPTVTSPIQNPPLIQQPASTGCIQTPTQEELQRIPLLQEIIQSAASGATTNIKLRGKIATMESYSVIPTTVETPISSELARVGDKIVLLVPNNITADDGTIVIPAGSRISGNVTAVTPAKLANKNAKIDIDFNSITLPSCETYAIQASIATENGVLEAGSLKSQALKGLLTSVFGAGSGAALGTALGAITGSTGRGAIYGTAIGGGLGVIGSIISRGGAIEIPSGEPLFIKLDKPFSIDVKPEAAVS